jgi:hypothetical protein
MKKFLIIASFLFVIFYAEKTYACSCLAPDPNQSLEQQVTEAYENSTAVFSAKVLSISENSAEYSKTIKLKLTKSWKGKFGKSITVTTAMDSAMCGYNFEIGKTYLIYANGKDVKNLSAGLCSRTAQLKANEDVKVLHKLKKKT